MRRSQARKVEKENEECGYTAPFPGAGPGRGTPVYPKVHVMQPNSTQMKWAGVLEKANLSYPRWATFQMPENKMCGKNKGLRDTK